MLEEFLNGFHRNLKMKTVQWIFLFDANSGSANWHVTCVTRIFFFRLLFIATEHFAFYFLIKLINSHSMFTAQWSSLLTGIRSK